MVIALYDWTDPRASREPERVPRRQSTRVGAARAAPCPRPGPVRRLVCKARGLTSWAVSTLPSVEPLGPQRSLGGIMGDTAASCGRKDRTLTSTPQTPESANSAPHMGTEDTDRLHGREEADVGIQGARWPPAAEPSSCTGLAQGLPSRRGAAETGATPTCL